MKRLELGPNTQISDEIVFKIYAQTGLADLEEFHCEKGSTGLTLVTLTLLLNNCPNLRAVSDIQNWAGLSGGEVGVFRQHCHDNNLDLGMFKDTKLEIDATLTGRSALSLVRNALRLSVLVITRITVSTNNSS